MARYHRIDTVIDLELFSRFTALPNSTAWGVYLRCHDDIGWAIDDSDAYSVGLNGHLHRMFLADYFTDKFFGADARGADFQTDAQSGERRTSGTAASLAGTGPVTFVVDDEAVSYLPDGAVIRVVPGRIDDSGVREVVAANAHAWPELWFPGAGWLRFEPTPA